MLVGTFLAFDKHLNIVISDTEEFRRIKPKKKGDPEREIKRPLGLLVLRGENIVSISAEAPPNNVIQRPDPVSVGPGKAMPITRQGAMPIQNMAQGQPMTVNQPPKGVGLPNPVNMNPTGMGGLSQGPPGIPGLQPPPGMPPMGMPPGQFLPPPGAGMGLPPNMMPPPGMPPMGPGGPQNMPPNMPPPGAGNGSQGL